MSGAQWGGTIADVWSAERANDTNRDIAREQMQFQRQMSNTAHTREVRDLLNAGLNPMLSAKLGGASSPAGASATVQPITSNSAQKILLNQQAEKLEAETDYTKAQEALANVTAAKIAQETMTSANSAANLQANTAVLSATLPKIAAEVNELTQRIMTGKSQVALNYGHVAKAAQDVQVGKAEEKLLDRKLFEMQGLFQYVQDLLNFDSQIRRSQIPEATAHGEAWSSGALRAVGPYMGAISQGASAAADISSIFTRGRTTNIYPRGTRGNK